LWKGREKDWGKSIQKRVEEWHPLRGERASLQTRPDVFKKKEGSLTSSRRRENGLEHRASRAKREKGARDMMKD